MSCPEPYLSLQTLSYRVVVIDFTYKQMLPRSLDVDDYGKKG